MSITTVAELRTALGVGTLYADAVLQEVCDAADDVLLPFIWINNTFNTHHSNTLTTATFYFDSPITDIFYIGEQVTVTKNGADLNGTHGIINLSDYSLTVELSTAADEEEPKHAVNPYGIVAGKTYQTISALPAVQEAALMISIDIWQSRQAPSSGGVSIDGYTPSPYRMGNTLLARVRGLIAPYLDPRSMVG